MLRQRDGLAYVSCSAFNAQNGYYAARQCSCQLPDSIGISMPCLTPHFAGSYVNATCLCEPLLATLAPHCLPEGRGAVQVSSLSLDGKSIAQRRDGFPKVAMTFQ